MSLLGQRCLAFEPTWSPVVMMRQDITTFRLLRRGQDHVFLGPGEYEVNGVFITGVETYHSGKVGERERNTSFLYQFEDLSVCHLGDLGTLPSREQVELLSGADVLLLPVGGGDTLDAAKAVEIVTELEPKIVIPMHYALPNFNLDLDEVDKFLKEMGVPAPEPVPLLKLTKSDLLIEEIRVVLLEPTRSWRVNKYISLTLLFFLLLFAACGGGATPPDQAPAAQQPATRCP